MVSFPLSLLYRIAVGMKNFCYDKKILVPYRVGCKVISIGNISVGGTGKTPLVKTLATLLAKTGYRIAVLSRGYGGKASKTICVSDGNKILSTAEQSGDEPLLLAKNLPGIPVITGADRIESAQWAEKKFQVEVIILDDGFQHRKIHRDIDILTINAVNPRGNGMLLPGGPLREPWKNIGRSDVMVITHSDKTNTTNTLQYVIRKYSSKPIFLSRHQPVSFFTFAHKKIPLSSLKNQPIVAFSGIANPDLFHDTLFNIGCDIKEFIAYPDHHYFTKSDKKNIIRKALDKKARFIITTEKDRARIDQWDKKSIPLYFLKIELTFITELPTFQQFIENRLHPK